MRVADVLLGLGRHEASRVFRRYVRDTRHDSTSPRLRGEDCLPRRSTAKAGGEGRAQSETRGLTHVLFAR